MTVATYVVHHIGNTHFRYYTAVQQQHARLMSQQQASQRQTQEDVDRHEASISQQHGVQQQHDRLISQQHESQRHLQEEVDRHGQVLTELTQLHEPVHLPTETVTGTLFSNTYILELLFYVLTELVYIF